MSLCSSSDAQVDTQCVRTRNVADRNVQFHGMRLDNLDVRRADAPAPQGAGGQHAVPDFTYEQVEFLYGEHPPSEAGRSTSVATQPFEEPQAATHAPAPYPDDEPLIERFRYNAETSGNNRSTARNYADLLTSFSGWLRAHRKPGLQGRLFDDRLTRDAQKFAKQRGPRQWGSVEMALKYLRDSETRPAGAVHIPSQLQSRNLEVPEEDRWLIDEAFPGDDKSSSDYRSSLNYFSACRLEKGEPGLCDEDTLHSAELMASAQTYVKEGGKRCTLLIPALKHLRNFERSQTPAAYRFKRNTSTIPAEDEQFSKQFEVWLRANGFGGKVDSRRRVGLRPVDNASKQASDFRSFSAWLQQVRKDPRPLTSRLHDPTLQVDVDLYAHEKKDRSFAGRVKTILKRARMAAASPDWNPNTSAAEAAGSSYSSMIPPTPVGGWPAASSNWNPDTPAGSSYSSMFPPTPVGGWPAASPSWNPDTPAGSSYSSMFPPTPVGGWPAASPDWNPDTPAEEVAGHSWAAQPESSTFGYFESLDSRQRHGGLEFDLNALPQEITGPRRNAAVSAAPIPTFDEHDTGPHWEHGAQVAPQWLLDRGAFDQQIVRIRGLEYRVAAMQGMSNAWGEPRLYLYPHLRGG